MAEGRLRAAVGAPEDPVDLQMTPVVGSFLHRKVRWIPNGPADPWLVLSPDADDRTVTRILGVIAAYNDAVGSTLEGTLAKLEPLARAGELAVSGGLRVRVGAFEILPSCCCGLEGWREWYEVKPGGQSPWLGHDPNPYVECGAETAVLWTDEARRGGVSLTVSFASIKAARALAAATLEGFVDRLALWIEKHAPAATAFPDAFATAFVRPQTHSD